MGLADWDLLSLIPGFAQATSLTANQYPNGKGFDCPNQSLGAEAAMMSDEMLKSVGQALCSKDELQVAAALRGTSDIDGHRNWTSGGRRVVRQAAVPRLQLRPDTMMYEPVAKQFEVASIEPVRVQTARDLLEDITGRRHRSDAIDPCAGTISRRGAGCDGEPPKGDDGHHSGGGGSDRDDDDHIDLGDNDHSGSGRDDDDDDHSGDGSHGDNDGDSSHDGDDDNSGHDSSDDYADNGGSHGGDDGDSHHDGGDDSDDDDRSGSSDGDRHSGEGSDDGDRHGDDDDHDGEDSSGSGSSRSGSGSHG